MARVRMCLVTREVLTSLQEGTDYFTVPTSQCNAGAGIKFISAKAMQWDTNSIVGNPKNGNPCYRISMKIPVSGNMVIHGITMTPQILGAYAASLFRCSVKVGKDHVVVKTTWYANLSGLRDRLCQVLEAAGSNVQETSFQVEFSTYLEEETSCEYLEDISKLMADDRDLVTSIFGRGFHGHAGNKSLSSDKNWMVVSGNIWKLNLIQFEEISQFVAVLDLIIQTVKKIQSNNKIDKILKLWVKAAGQETSPYFRSIKEGLNRLRAEEKFSKVRLEEKGGNK